MLIRSRAQYWFVYRASVGLGECWPRACRSAAPRPKAACLYAHGFKAEWTRESDSVHTINLIIAASAQTRRSHFRVRSVLPRHRPAIFAVNCKSDYLLLGRTKIVLGLSLT